MTIFSQLLIAFSFSFFFMNEREFQIIWEQRGMRPALTLTRGTWAMTRTFSVYTFIFSIQGPDKGSVLYASGGTKKSALGATQQLLIWLRYCTKIERCFFDFYPFFFFFFCKFISELWDQMLELGFTWFHVFNCEFVIFCTEMNKKLEKDVGYLR